jgi:hypothetical protein
MREDDGGQGQKKITRRTKMKKLYAVVRGQYVVFTSNYHWIACVVWFFSPNTEVVDISLPTR